MLDKIKQAMPEIKAQACAKINEALPDLKVITSFSRTQASLVIVDVTEEFSSQEANASGLYLVVHLVFIETTIKNVVQTFFNLKESGDIFFLSNKEVTLDMTDIEVVNQSMAQYIANKIVKEYKDYKQACLNKEHKANQP